MACIFGTVLLELTAGITDSFYGRGLFEGVGLSEDLRYPQHTYGTRASTYIPHVRGLLTNVQRLDVVESAVEASAQRLVEPLADEVESGRVHVGQQLARPAIRSAFRVAVVDGVGPAPGRRVGHDAAPGGPLAMRPKKEKSSLSLSVQQHTQRRGYVDGKRRMLHKESSKDHP